MDEHRFNMSLRKFLKEVGVTSQQEIERVVREENLGGKGSAQDEDGADGRRHRAQPCGRGRYRPRLRCECVTMTDPWPTELRSIRTSGSLP